MTRFGFGYLSNGGTPGNDAFTKILLHMDGANGGTTFTDVNAGGSAHTWAASGVTIDATGGAFNSGAMLGPYITTPHSSDFDLSGSVFTFDFRINLNGLSAPSGAFLFGDGSAGSGNAGQFSLQLNSSGTIAFNLFLSTGTIQSTSTSNFFSLGLTHVAIVRESGATLKMYVGGAQQASRSDLLSGTTTPNSNNFSIGRSGDFASFPMPSAGRVDEFRLSVGAARWTANFTPPTSAYV